MRGGVGEGVSFAGLDADEVADAEQDGSTFDFKPNFSRQHIETLGHGRMGMPLDCLARREKCGRRLRHARVQPAIRQNFFEDRSVVIDGLRNPRVGSAEVHEEGEGATSRARIERAQEIRTA